MKNKKKLYWLLESNADLSVTCASPKAVIDMLESDFDNLSKQEQRETQYTTTPVWYTDKEYAELPED